MSNTSDLNILCLQMSADDQIRVDKANGTFDANLAADPTYYLQYSQFQTIPVGMDGNPEQFVQLLVDAMPHVNALRLCFNEHCFNADGSLHPQFERFLEAAAQAGLKLIVGYSGNEVSRLGDDGSVGGEALRETLNGSAIQGLTGAWKQMLDWLDDHPSVADAVHGLEIANEPATYARAERLTGNTGEFVRLYADHMLALAEMIDARSDARILVGGWNYSGKFDILASTSYGEGTVLDALRAGIGSDLIWSAHLYPAWLPDGVQTGDQIAAAYEALWGVLGDDDILLTETNAIGNLVNDASQHDPSFNMARYYELLSDRGIGIGWFPGVDYGASSLAVLDAWGRGGVRYLHPASLAHALNAFSLGESDPEVAGDDRLAAVLRAGKVQSEATGRLMAGVDGIATAFGGDGNDTLTGIARAVNMLYGGTGNDSLVGAESDDHLFGQDGDDTLRGGDGDDVILGGRGNDLVDGGAGDNTLTGGLGADVFRLLGTSDTAITDYDRSEGDQIYIGSALFTPAQLEAQGTMRDLDGDGYVDDLLLTTASGRVRLINYANVVRDGIVSGTDGNDVMDDSFVDYDGDTTNWRGSTIRAGAGDDRVLGKAGNDTIRGEGGHDSIDGRGGDDSIMGDIGDDTLLGSGGHDVIEGGRGWDVLDGGWGEDTLDGGMGNDLIQGRAGNDLIRGGDGADTLFGGTDNGNWLNGDGFDGSAGGLNTLEGGNGSDRLYGARDRDLLIGGTGADTLVGNDGDDTLRGDTGTDHLNGGRGDDLLIGGAGNDTLECLRGSDTLMGGAGDDVILTAPGAGLHAQLYGEDGADSFVFRVGRGDGWGTAVIHDFQIGLDRLVIEGIGDLAQVLHSDQVAWIRQVGADVKMLVQGDYITLADTSLDLLA